MVGAEEEFKREEVKINLFKAIRGRRSRVKIRRAYLNGRLTVFIYNGDKRGGDIKGLDNKLINNNVVFILI